MGGSLERLRRGQRQARGGSRTLFRGLKNLWHVMFAPKKADAAVVDPEMFVPRVGRQTDDRPVAALSRYCNPQIFRYSRLEVG